MNGGTVVLFQTLLCNLLINVKTTAYGNLRVRVNVPQFKVFGEVTQLQCDYNLNQDSLYSVKWYKDHEEFYRYVPRRKPAATSFKVDGVNVDMNVSDSKKVILKSVGLNTTGVFRCEVSAEAPSFASAQSEARMEVIYFPKEEPKISGLRAEYKLGDEIHVNCTSGKSYPASTLSWYINDKEVINNEEVIRYQYLKNKRGFVTSILGLKVILAKDHFVQGSMKLKCISSLWPSPWKSIEDNVLQTSPSMEIKEAILIVKSSSSSHFARIALITLQFLLLTIFMS